MTVYYSDNQGDGIHFRVPTQDDLTKLQEHRNSRKIYPNLTSIMPVYNQQKWYESLGSENLYFIICKNMTVGDIGLIRITDIDWQNRSACIGLDIFYGFQHQGWGAKGFDLLLKYCFEELRLHRVWLLVAEYNEPAKKIYTNAGLKYEGEQRDALWRDGAYHGYFMMSMLEDEYAALGH